MVLQDQILGLLKVQSGLTANQISENLSKNPNSVKVILHRLMKRNLIIREKKMREQKTRVGPQNLYTYSVKPV